MEGEMNDYIKIWLQVFLSLCYCYALAKIVPKGIPRLLAILPIVFLFLSLPLSLHSIHLGGTLSFFVAWLANFKLLLFAFGEGPLSDPSLSLKQFVALASFPIKIHENPPPKSSKKSQYSLSNGHTKSPNSNPPTKSHSNGENREDTCEKSQDPAIKTHKNGRKSLFIYAIKGLIFAGVVRSYEYSDYFHPKLLLTLYCLHIYLCLEIILVIVAALSRTLLGIELEPQFNEPYLSSSLQDFWGRRWNMVVPKILRPTIYEPVHNVVLRIMSRTWASFPAVLATFLVSGLMHELMFYYLGRVRPTWEITWFFVLHGFCLVIEIGLKKKLTDKIQLPRVISGPMTVGFVMVTAFWLFFPQLLRCKGDERALQEYAAVGAFVKNFSRTLTFNIWRTLQTS